ncbi:MAG: 3'(2'),5'-bisphosphate nucleotidase CysQ [Thermomicrobiales bacterium]
MQADETATGNWSRELAVAQATVREAAVVVKAFYDRADAGVYEKDDHTPLTDADLAADALIRERIATAFPDDGLLTEESADDPARLMKRWLWIADPIDGTKQFVDRTGEFDVFLALTVDGRPVVAVSAHPVSGQLLWASEGGGAWVEQGGEVQRLRFPEPPDDAAVRVATSHYHGAPATLPLLERASRQAGFGPPESLPVGFQTRAFIDSLTGDARYEVFIGPGRDIDGPNFSGGEWDNAATDLLVREAGGAFTDIRGRLFRYNKPDARNFGGIFAAVSPTIHARLLASLEAELPPISDAPDPDGA